MIASFNESLHVNITSKKRKLASKNSASLQKLCPKKRKRLSELVHRSSRKLLDKMKNPKNDKIGPPETQVNDSK